MKALHVDVDLAPVADLGIPGYYMASLDRAFSADPAVVARDAKAWAAGMLSAGVLPVVKHWPGHGQARDSHTGAATTPALGVLAGRDLVPFTAAFAARVPAVMVGHLTVPGLTEPGRPATLSPAAYRYLRGRAGQTLIMTDSMGMGAVTGALGLTEASAALRALQAGADVVLVDGNDPMSVVSVVSHAIDTRCLPERGRGRGGAAHAHVQASRQPLIRRGTARRARRSGSARSAPAPAAGAAGDRRGVVGRDRAGAQRHAGRAVRAVPVLQLPGAGNSGGGPDGSSGGLSQLRGVSRGRPPGRVPPSPRCPWPVVPKCVHRAPSGRPVPGRAMAETVYDVVELVGTGPETWGQAAEAAVTSASKSLRELRIAEVTSWTFTSTTQRFGRTAPSSSFRSKYESGLTARAATGVRRRTLPGAPATTARPLTGRRDAGRRGR